MFLDASAIVAILIEEEDGPKYEQVVLANKGKLYCSPIAIMEATLAIARVRHRPTKRQPKPDKEAIEDALDAVTMFLDGIEANEISITSSVGHGAIAALSKYGRAVGHKADLNMGDCYSYACARAYRIPLLYKGNDFKETDLA